ncbi:cytochrome oxidase maturation protein, cbb3-type [Sulfitobacter marinus]|uniref:Cytochrome oxidase maturation protein, cbb3-type n=2 Tax=Sulfitobacter TaxID=60136 RepID=A0A1I6VGU4_9RHOB|nr:cbb3-type cytochrome oxidase assembly protein CcoS [Sulfitobacter marinus]SFT12976.1 cytochrome oxidase maturation protein, cbb3-type [Sulfitobacter marinus]
MNVLLILIPVSIILGGLGLCGFLWTLRSGQYDDAEGSAARLLLDDDEPDKDEPVRRS